jgi:hypothetical protein
MKSFRIKHDFLRQRVFFPADEQVTIREPRQSTESPTLLGDLTSWQADHRPTAEM